MEEKITGLERIPVWKYRGTEFSVNRLHSCKLSYLHQSTIDITSQW